MRTIELLYFDGCPSWQAAWSELGIALAETRVDAHVHLRHIEDVPEAQRDGFAGSPTIRIDGRDLEGYDGLPLLACRRYEENEGRGWPSRERLRTALKAPGREERP